MCNHASLHIRLLHLRGLLRPATRTADETMGLHNQIISAKLLGTISGNRLQWTFAHLQWRSVLFMDEYRFQLYWADGSQRAWYQFADVNVVYRVPHGGGGVIVWAGISYRQRTQLHLIICNLNTQKYCVEILRPIVRPIFFKVSVTNRCISAFRVM